MRAMQYHATQAAHAIADTRAIRRTLREYQSDCLAYRRANPMQRTKHNTQCLRDMRDLRAELRIAQFIAELHIQFC